MSFNQKTTSGVIFLQRVREGKVNMARELRQNMTEPEKLLWKALRGSRHAGLKFRRQQVVEGFIVDFFCHSAKLIVEIDGPVHESDKNREYDEHRKKVFEARGLREIRFSNTQVIDDLDAVLEIIKKEAIRD